MQMIFCFISDPVKSISYVLDTLRKFGSFSGYKLNIAKSDFFPINEMVKEIPHSNLPFNFSRDKFKYLAS